MHSCRRARNLAAEGALVTYAWVPVCGATRLGGTRATAKPFHNIVGKSNGALVPRGSREGVAVTLVEKNSRAAAGGRLACETIAAANGRNYRFETGPSLLLLPSPLLLLLSSSWHRDVALPQFLFRF